MNTPYVASDAQLDALADALANPGYLIVDDALPAELAAALAHECRELPEPEFRPAGIGREQGHQVDARVRSDRILWLDGSSTPTRAYLDFMESIRLGLNSRLFLGLFDYESHYARYAAGAFYGVHKDAFAGQKNRVLSTALYLNDDWSNAAGGELLLYAPEGGALLERVRPAHNRLAIFLSERFPHEVKPPTRMRHSIAGWFRVQGGSGWPSV